MTTEAATEKKSKRKKKATEPALDPVIATELDSPVVMTGETPDAPLAHVPSVRPPLSAVRSVLTEKYAIYLADTVDVAVSLPDESMDFSVFSPPFASLYTYSNSPRDMGNCANMSQFGEHMAYLASEQHRALKSGRLVAIHCMLLPTTKGKDGCIALKDFRGELRAIYEKAGFLFHSEITIWKDPVTQMQRTHAIGLLHHQVKKDSSISRQGLADYLVVMRKRGDNESPIAQAESTPDCRRCDWVTTPDGDQILVTPCGVHELAYKNSDGKPLVWQRYASPVWYDINPSDTLQYRSARDDADERHICPLQLSVIRRAIRLWSLPGETVWSPFTGIGSEGYVAIEEDRRFIGAELKQSYFEQAERNLAAAGVQRKLTIDLDSVTSANPTDAPSAPTQSQPPDAQAFLADITATYKRHGMSISHEDTHGAFVITDYSQRNVDWLHGAQLQTRSEVKRLADEHMAQREREAQEEKELDAQQVSK